MNIQHLDYANVSEPSAWNPNRNNWLLKSESTVSMKIGFPADRAIMVEMPKIY